MTALAPMLQAFFTDRLIGQRQASPHTIAAYRDTLRLLLSFAAERTGKPPSELDIADLDAPLIGGVPRPPRTRPRQQRRAPATPGWPRSTRCSATPRCTTPSTPRHRARAGHPTQTLRPGHWSPTSPNAEIDALLAAPDRTPGPGGATTPCSLLAVQTGLRVSELTGLTAATSTSAPARDGSAVRRCARAVDVGQVRAAVHLRPRPPARRRPPPGCWPGWRPRPRYCPAPTRWRSSTSTTPSARPTATPSRAPAAATPASRGSTRCWRSSPPRVGAVIAATRLR